VLSELNLIDIIPITEVQSHDPESPRLTNYSEFIKLCPIDHPLGGGKGGGVCSLLRVAFTQRIFESIVYPK